MLPKSYLIKLIISCIFFVPYVYGITATINQGDSGPSEQIQLDLNADTDASVNVDISSKKLSKSG